MMRSIAISLGLALACMTVPAVAEAQQAGKIYRVGFLTTGPAHHFKARIAAIRGGLEDLGYVAGKNVLLMERYANGQRDKLPILATELVGQGVDVVIVQGDMPARVATRVAKEKGRKLPVVMLTVDPVGNGTVASLAKPGGNITGLAMDAGPGFYAKRLEIMKELVPTVRNVAVFWSSNVRSHRRQLKEIEASVPAFGIKVSAIDHTKSDSLESSFVAAKNRGADALIVIGSSYMGSRSKQLAKLAIKYRLPALYSISKFPKAGGLLSYGTDFPALFRRAAIYVDKILKGAKPADMPIERPSKLELVINLKAAKALGITVPKTLLLRADVVIE